MKNLVFREIRILSKAEKRAICLILDPKLNLFVGQNDVGKSTLAKSLYHCMGADVPQLENTTWQKASPIYCVTIEINHSIFYIIRDERYFGVFNEERQLLERYSSIGGADGVANFVNRHLDFDIQLERQNSNLGTAGPAFYFLPFYIDQDEGWNSSWNSFKGLQQFRAYRTQMIDYHLGVRPQSYYDAKKTTVELKERLSELDTQKVLYQTARSSVYDDKRAIQFDLNPDAFRTEMEELTSEYGEFYSQQQSVLERIKDLRSRRGLVDNELAMLERAEAELASDYEYSANAPDEITCPVCESHFENSIVERFQLVEDMAQCSVLADEWRKTKYDLSRELEHANEEYQLVSSRMKEVQALLDRTKQNVSLYEVVVSIGLSRVLVNLNSRIQELIQREEPLLEELKENASFLKVDSNRKKEIINYYMGKMKEFLNLLNVSVLNEADYSTPHKQIKNNALGSDLPRALLAQHFAFLHTMKEFNKFVLCPLVIDSPFQQEQDPSNRQAIFNFLLSQSLEGQQIILATVTVSDVAPNSFLKGGKILELDDKLSLLQTDQYEEVLEDIGEMHRLTLER